MTDLANPEQLLFVSTTQTFLEKQASLTHVRGLHASGVAFQPEWWQRAAELGWTSLLVPEELGGGSVSGDGVADLALVAEQVGTPSPLGRCIRSVWCSPGSSRHRRAIRTPSTRSSPVNWSRRGRCTNPGSRSPPPRR